MGLRFRRRLTLMPGVRLNVSGSGLSLSVGPRGASVTMGQRGTFLNTSIPGTGLYSRQRLSDSEPRRPVPTSTGATTTVKAALALDDDGTWTLRNTDGSPIDPTLRQAMIAQNKRLLVDSLGTLCDQANSKAESLGQLHWTAPDPARPPSYDRKPFPEDPLPKPEPPQLRPYSFFDRHFTTHVLGGESEQIPPSLFFRQPGQPGVFYKFANGFDTGSERGRLHRAYSEPYPQAIT